MEAPWANSGFYVGYTANAFNRESISSALFLCLDYRETCESQIMSA